MKNKEANTEIPPTPLWTRAKIQFRRDALEKEEGMFTLAVDKPIDVSEPYPLASLMKKIRQELEEIIDYSTPHKHLRAWAKRGMVYFEYQCYANPTLVKDHEFYDMGKRASELLCIFQKIRLHFKAQENETAIVWLYYLTQDIERLRAAEYEKYAKEGVQRVAWAQNQERDKKTCHQRAEEKMKLLELFKTLSARFKSDNEVFSYLSGKEGCDFYGIKPATLKKRYQRLKFEFKVDLVPARE